MFLGCFSSGSAFNMFKEGLTQYMISTIPGISSVDALVNGFYRFTLTSGMSINSCTSICLELKFAFSGISAGYLFIITLDIIQR